LRTGIPDGSTNPWEKKQIEETVGACRRAPSRSNRIVLVGISHNVARADVHDTRHDPLNRAGDVNGLHSQCAVGPTKSSDSDRRKKPECKEGEFPRAHLHREG
jgi:hypothetical protein